VGRLANPVVEGERVVFPAGTELRGHVTKAVTSGKLSGRGVLGFRFDHVSVKGSEHEIGLSPVEIISKSATGKDAKMIGGGAAVGAVVGAIAGGKKGALIGAGVGAGTGTGAAAMTQGPQAKAPAGSTWAMRTTREFSI
jgi:hypothetical protein